MNGVYIDIEGYFKNHYWNGWWWDRTCLHRHYDYDDNCVECQDGSWYYTPVSQTGMKRFGRRIIEK